MAKLKSLSQFKGAGGILSREPVMVTGTWKHKDENGEDIEDTFEIGVVKVSFGDMADLFNEKDREHMALSLSKSVMLLNEKGKLEFISYDDAYRLEPGLATVIMELVRTQNGGSAKNSRPPTNSSANSSSTESAAEPSKKQDKT